MKWKLLFRVYVGFRDNFQYYGSIFLLLIMVHGTLNGPQNDIGNYLGPCSSRFQGLR